MKKFILFILGVFFLTGCSLNTDMTKDTPTKKVESFFSNYQTLSSDVLADLDNVIKEEETMDDTQKEEYKDFMKKHYQDLEYEIKDEVIDGDKATVTAEIKVRNYSKTLNDADTYLESHKDEFNDEEGIYNPYLFTKYRMEQLSKITEKETYTIDLTLSKINDEWKLDQLTPEQEQKINGTYQE